MSGRPQPVAAGRPPHLALGWCLLFFSGGRHVAGAVFSPPQEEAPMGDKSPKNKQREKNQKSAAKTQTKTNQANRQASFSSAAVGKEKKK
jgi:hypothetical protein